MTYQTELAQAETALGNDAPTLAYNLDTYVHYAPVLQFLDITKSMRRWEGNLEDGSGKVNYDVLDDGGYLDESGWIKEFPEGVSSVSTLWQWKNRSELGLAEDVRGVYVLEYEGTGEVVVSGDAKIISSEPGKIVFENINGQNLYMGLRSTDPEGTGDYVRNISIVAEKNLPLYEAGALFNPAWLELIEDARELRFLGWNGTNNATLTSWDERSVPDGPFWGTGVPVEYMVQLANEVGADPWFTIPHTADEEYIRNFATYVRDNLDPELTAKVEYSNEAWNWAFDQTGWLYEQAQAEWGTPALNDYYVKKAVETALIWEDVFGEEADARLVNVLATQTRNPGLTERILEAETWKANEPDAWVDPGTVFDELAVTTYFGNNTVTDATLRADLIAAINDPDVDAAAYLAEKLMDPDYNGSIPQIAEALAANAALAEEHGLKLSSYEGGQHVHHTFSVSDLSAEDTSVLQDFMIDFVRSEEMGELYRELWDVWVEYGDGPFMQFGDIGTPSKSGSWALYAGLEDSTPRSEALEELNDSTSPWWEDASEGSQYQHGLVNEGAEGADLLIGTSSHDYLLGMDGDDILVGGEGNDGLNGGAGTDRAVLSGSFSDYSIRIEGEGYRVDGLDGSDFLINIEELAFSDNQVVSLSKLLESSDGTLVLELPPEPVEPDEPKDSDTPKAPDDGTLGGGDIKSGIDYDEIDIEDFTGNNGGIVIKSISNSSTLAQSLDIDPANYSPNYLTYAKETHEFSNLVQLISNNLSGVGQPILEMHNAAIVTQATKILATNGDDSFFGGNTNDFISGQGGEDYMIGGAGDDTLYGGDGNDRLIGNSGNDALFGGGGNDHINGGGGSDTIEGGAGEDKIYAGEGNDKVYGGNGNDWVSAGGGDDSVFGGQGNDLLKGDDGDDYLMGAAGDDTLYGGNGDDRLIGNSGSDSIFGGEGDDHINAGGDNDVIFSGTGADKIYAGSGDDIVHGEDGNDFVSGGDGNDQIHGGQGNDTLKGEAGDDILKGNEGNDALIGGDGNDQFVFDLGDGQDQIKDFSREDTLNLKEFFSGNQTLEDAASMENGHLVLSNGEDRITLLGLDTEDLSWMNVEM